MNGLMLHTGAHNATLAEIAAAPTPAATATWQPIAHAVLVDTVKSQLGAFGLTIVEEAHGLYKGGDRYFGVLGLRNGQNADDFGLTVGLRNSHDKRFPAGFAVGSRVFVCDNLSFSSEIVFGRRHTLNIVADLPGLINRALGRLGDHRDGLNRRIEAYKSTSITDAAAHDVAIRSLDAKVIGPTALPRLIGEWRRPTHDDFAPRTAWSLFNAYTEILKGVQLADLARRTQTLHGMFDNLVGLDKVLTATEIAAD